MRKRFSGKHHKFQRVIERSRIGFVGFNDGEEFIEVFAKEIRFHNRLACGHPHAIAFYGIDLAVVRQKAERLSQIPGGEGIGRKAGVDQCA